jgi:tRNA pseudouridine32 synthase/23S rRNA pseudouridine746 synthase
MKLQRNICAPKSGERAIDLLAQAIPELSRQQLKQAMQKGAVWLKQGKGERRLRRVTQPVQAGAIIAVYYDDDLLSRKTELARLLADEHDYTIWIKPAGMLAQGTKFGDHCSLLFVAEQYFQPRRTAYLVHRLDSAASGLMLIAHTSRAAAAFSEMFQRRNLTKRYRVTVEGLLDSDIKTLDQALDDKEAVTHIEAIVHRHGVQADGGRSELTVRIETGRKHQIRRHLASIGHPVIGDREYGSQFTREPLQLIATELSFVCPLTQKQKNYFLS